MRAIRIHAFGGLERLTLEDVPVPRPGAGEVLVKVAAAGVNPADTYIRSGAYAVKPRLPFTPGFDAGGEVESVGPGVYESKPGRRVYVAFTLGGTYAEYVVAKGFQVHPLPEGLSFEQGAGIGVPYAAAYRALFGRARARYGETVLIHGASGGVGLAAVQLARAAGLTVIATAGSEKGRRLVLEQGAHHALDHASPDSMTELRTFLKGDGVDIIIEMLANENLDRDLQALAFKGRVVVVGNRGRIEIDPRMTMTGETSILGMSLWNLSPEGLAAVHAALAPGLADGSLHPVVGRTLPLSEAARAHEAVLEPGAHGKILLIP